MSKATTPSPSPPPEVRAAPILRTQVWSRMNIRDDNWMGAVVGETGSGKSLTALSIAQTVDPNFSIDQVAFSVEEFMQLVTDRSLGPGSIIVFEEASVEAAAGEWHSKSNKVLRNVLDTWRHQNRGAIFTLPSFGQLDKGARLRMTALIQQEELHASQGYSVAKYKHLQTNSDSGEIYRHFPVINGQKHKRLKIRRPTPDLLTAYNERKENYTHELNEQLLEELLDEKYGDDKNETPPAAEIAETILTEGTLDNYISDNHGQQYIDRSSIELDYDIGRNKSKQVKTALLREVDIDVM